MRIRGNQTAISSLSKFSGNALVDEVRDIRVQGYYFMGLEPVYLWSAMCMWMLAHCGQIQQQEHAAGTGSQTRLLCGCGWICHIGRSLLCEYIR